MRLRTSNHYLSEDLAQDVFVRLLDYEPMLRPETIKSFVFTVAKNILIDFLRKKIKHPTCSVNDLDETLVHSTEESDNRIIYKEIALLEKQMLTSFPCQRRMVYTLQRYNDRSICEISTALNISKRTVESHLYTGRKEMREYIARCV
jgi:RNA polymerase sigma-70 factor (ECF subfamily)